MAIRYSRELRQQIDDTIRKYNAKIDRVRRRGQVERDTIPDKRQYSDFVGTFNSRKELLRELASLERYTHRGAEKTVQTDEGYSLSNWEINELKRDIRREKTALTKEMRKYEVLHPYVLGTKQDTTYAKMGDPQYENLKVRYKAIDKDIIKLSKQEFKRLKKRTKTYHQNRGTEKQKQLRENYIDMLMSLGYLVDLDKNVSNRVIEKISSLSPSDFMRLFERDKAVQAILDYYYPTVSSVGGLKVRTPFRYAEVERDVIDLYNLLDTNLDDMIDKLV